MPFVPHNRGHFMGRALIPLLVSSWGNVIPNYLTRLLEHEKKKFCLWIMYWGGGKIWAPVSEGLYPSVLQGKVVYKWYQHTGVGGGSIWKVVIRVWMNCSCPKVPVHHTTATTVKTSTLILTDLYWKCALKKLNVTLLSMVTFFHLFKLKIKDFFWTVINFISLTVFSSFFPQFVSISSYF